MYWSVFPGVPVEPDQEWPPSEALEVLVRIVDGGGGGGGGVPGGGGWVIRVTPSFLPLDAAEE